MGGTDVPDLPLKYPRSGIATVMRDVFQFNDTIRKNLLIGHPDTIIQPSLVGAIREPPLLPRNTLFGDDGIGRKGRIFKDCLKTTL